MPHSQTQGTCTPCVNRPPCLLAPSAQLSPHTPKKMNVQHKHTGRGRREAVSTCELQLAGGEGVFSSKFHGLCGDRFDPSENESGPTPTRFCFDLGQIFAALSTSSSNSNTVVLWHGSSTVVEGA